MSCTLENGVVDRFHSASVWCDEAMPDSHWQSTAWIAMADDDADEDLDDFDEDDFDDDFDDDFEEEDDFEDDLPEEMDEDDLKAL